MSLLFLKHSLLLIFVFLIHTAGLSQNKTLTSHTWLKQHVENLSDQQIEADTLYTRYKFEKAKLYISFYPTWSDYQVNWSIRNNQLTIGFDTYTIEELTDSSLTIALSGFRRISFLAEDYCNSQERYLQPIGEYNGKPLYQANKFITPRYSTKESLRPHIEQGTKAYSIPNAAYFKVTFIVTENGKIENIKVISSILEGFDNAVISQLKKTSGKWQPATFKGKAVQTETFYEIKYLKSSVPYKSGKIN